MNNPAPSKRVFISAGVYAVACAPAILLAERFGWPESFFHITQFVAAVLCFLAAGLYLWSTRGLRFDGRRRLAGVACVLSGLWLAFVVYVLLTLDFSGID